MYDLGEFDQKGGVSTNWGTKEELLSLVSTAKEHGIVTYIDAVLNHKFGADRVERFGATEVDTNDRTKEISEVYDVEVSLMGYILVSHHSPRHSKGWTGFDFPGRGDKVCNI